MSESDEGKRCIHELMDVTSLWDAGRRFLCLECGDKYEEWPRNQAWRLPKLRWIGNIRQRKVTSK